MVDAYIQRETARNEAAARRRHQEGRQGWLLLLHALRTRIQLESQQLGGQQAQQATGQQAQQAGAMEEQQGGGDVGEGGDVLGGEGAGFDPHGVHEQEVSAGQPVTAGTLAQALALAQVQAQAQGQPRGVPQENLDVEEI